VKYYGGHTADSVRQPIGTLTASYEHYGLAQGFLVGVGGPRSLHREISLQIPLRSQLSQNHLALVQPLVVNIDNGSNANVPKSLAAPLTTIVSKARHCLLTAFLIPFFGERAGQSPRCQSISDPLATVTGQGAGAMIQPYIISLRGTGDNMARPKQLSEPVVTLTAGNHEYLVQPFLFSYYGHGSEFSLAGPMPTATGRDRFALVHGAITYSESYPRWALDIHLRMLDPQELKLAHSFGPDYQFCGTRADQVKQIGNSWPCGMGEALSRAILEGVNCES
jgi:DNA (cytosine-5)-methyltransferase 1